MKPLQQESLLFDRHMPSPRIPALAWSLADSPRHAIAHTPNNDTARTRLWNGRAGRAGRAVASRESTDEISNDDSLSDSDPDASSDDDECRSENEQRRPSARKNSRWDEIDEQRLRVYKEEGKAGSGSSRSSQPELNPQSAHAGP
jgi:hypothetical protein